MQVITTPQQLFEEVCECFGKNPNDINSFSRKRDKVKIRQYYCYVGRVYFKFSLISLGEILVSKHRENGKDHSTIIHSHSLIKGLIDIKDPVTLNDIEALKFHLNILPVTKGNYEDLLEENTKLVGEILEMKMEIKKKDSTISQLNQKNFEQRQTIKKLTPRGIFGQPIQITKLTKTA